MAASIHEKPNSFTPLLDEAEPESHSDDLSLLIPPHPSFFPEDLNSPKNVSSSRSQVKSRKKQGSALPNNRMKYSPMGFQFHRLQVIGSSLSPKKCMLIFVLFLMVVATFVRLIFTIRHAYSDYHIMTDDDGELVFLPRDVVFSHGAYCLDGSRPGLYIRKGIDEGSNKWLIALPHADWCFTDEQCYQRSKEPMEGTTKGISPTLPFAGLLSSSAAVNPKFAKWNMALLVSCDGASFLSNGSDVRVHDQMLYKRGSAIFMAASDYLVRSTSLAFATEVLLYGKGSGAIGAVLHSQTLGDMLPKSVNNYKVISDGGLFYKVEDKSLQSLARLHGFNDTKTASLAACSKDNPTDIGSCLNANMATRYTRAPTLLYSSYFQHWPVGARCPPRGCDLTDTVAAAIQHTGDSDAALTRTETSSYKAYANDGLGFCRVAHTVEGRRQIVKGSEVSLILTFCEMPLLLLEDSNAAFEKVKEHPLVIGPVGGPSVRSGTGRKGMVTTVAEVLSLSGGKTGLYDTVVRWFEGSGVGFVVCEGESNGFGGAKGQSDQVSYAEVKAKKCL